MNIGIIGYGKMGRAIEATAVLRGHKIASIVDLGTGVHIDADFRSHVDVAVEFTTPSATVGNVMTCLQTGIPVVSGTTGASYDLQQIQQLCTQQGIAFLHSSNFSIGMNIFMEINARLARLLAGYDYAVDIEETHHVHKKDKPSGTAITLANGICDNHSGYVGWELTPDNAAGKIPITSIREGEIFGIHQVSWHSPNDDITIRHEAKNRSGLALGAVLAAEFIHNKVGIFTMKDFLNF